MIELQPLRSPVIKTITIPGSKSYTNRALLLGALTQDAVVIKNPLFSDDTRAMIDSLHKLGIRTEQNETSITVVGNFQDVENKDVTLDCHLSGTTIRFLTALACIVPGTKILTGQEGLCKRPIGPLVDGLRLLGAKIEYVGKEGFPPIKITSSSLRQGTTHLTGDMSSQYFSAIMMVAPVVGDITIDVIGHQISKPYIDMTIDTIKKFGADVINYHYTSYHIPDCQGYHKDSYTVEGDFSSAGYFLAVAALTQSTLTLDNLNPHSKQADAKIMGILESMGNTITLHERSITIAGKAIAPIEVNMEDFPDQAQTLAVLCAFAKGKSILKGVKSLRIKETERVQALTTELAKMGIKTETTEDSITIFGGDPQPATIDTYGDHRMAMSFAVAGAKLEGMKINHPEVVEKTFPNFWDELKQIGVGIC
ncbi:MAG TPA: 3-phosphoshikimate 1-carboxyvinyltransferase [Patescibacteria group bacterium]|nr:3-phosphoshikimate 1-carboxyvinyltransferase [Patescibacteria group bacterium]